MTLSYEKIPALSIKLYGKNLVEASAGTGKTWTLTGILLRILLENTHIAPRQISAVTFTRKATAEMRSRLQNRFDSFSYLCRKLLEIYQHDTSFLADDLLLAERILFACENFSQNTDKYLADAAADKVNIYLLEEASKNGLNSLIALFERIALLEKELDEIFIGTLDSLAENWLEEFAVETGYAAPDKFVEKQSPQMLELIQNNLRKQYQEEKFLSKLPSEINDEIRSAEDFCKEIAAKEIFISNYKSDGYLPDTSEKQQEIKTKRREIYELFRRIDEIKKSPEFLQALAQLPNIREQILEKCPIFVRNADKNKLKNIDKYCSQAELNIFFNHLQIGNINLANPYFERAIKLLSGEHQNKKDKNKYEEFRNSAIGQILATVLEPYCLELEIKNKNNKDGLKEALNENKKYRKSVNIDQLILDLKNNLSHKLEEQSVASFNSQFERLNKALNGEKGAELARYIARRYPVMLVDESQDLNNAQSDLLEKIYLQNTVSGGFFMPVGDPKQAIYRFRGGDEQNYENLKAKFKAEEISELNQSYRSSPEMVAAINEFYQFLGENKQLPYQNASSAVEKAELVYAGGEKIEKTLLCTTVTSSEEYQAIARQVAYLLSEKSPYRRIEGGGQRQILPEDILILMPKNSELRGVREELQKLGIAADCPSEEYLFAGEVAKSLHFLFCAIWNPDDFANLNALLASVFFDKNEEESRLILQSWQIGDESAPEKQADIAAAKVFYTKLMQILNKAREMWIKRKLPAALQFVLSAEIAGESIWERLAGREILESKRYLSDLRQIQEIVNSEGRVLSAAAFIRYWQRNLVAPEETGIKSEAVDAADKSAVRLLTFHKAKGLENHIVFIGGLKKNGAGGGEKPLLNLIRNPEGRLTISCRYPEDETAKQNRQKEENAEDERVLYVALTRARNLLFLFFRSVKNEIAYKDWCKNFWGALEEEKFPHIASFSVPLESEIRPNAQVRQEKSAALAQNTEIPSPFSKTGWRKTSFSALNLEREEEHSSADLQDFAVEEIEIAKEEIANERAIEDLIQNNFPAGARAGSFLHKALEEYGTKPLPILLAKLNRRFNLGLGEEAQKQSQDWIEKIMQSKLASGVELKNIQSLAREMGFSLSVNRGKNLPIKDINKLLANWGKPVLLNENYRQAVGFLRGEIDLCYEYQGRFFVVDYKSNKLGRQAADYSEARKIAEMNKHGYWLQALIYQTALHRFLAQRLPDYQPEKNLAAVEYLFLRAVEIADASLKIEIPVEIVLGFDAILRS